MKNVLVKKRIRKEITQNFKNVLGYFIILNKLIIRQLWKLTIRKKKHSVTSFGSKIIRFFFNQTIRTQKFSLDEYALSWSGFDFKKNCEVSNLNYVKNGKLIEGNISSMEFRKRSVITELADIIEKYKFSSVLEIGSGIGINLIFLASRFPNIHFYGIEPTETGVIKSKELILNIPGELSEFGIKQNKLENITILQGNILDKDFIKSLNIKADLVFTNGVLEQLNNYLEDAFDTIFSLPCDYILLREEWLEVNFELAHYKRLVSFDYFRISWKYLNNYPIEIIEYKIPVLQPQWLKYASVFGKKIHSI